jgi:hypothetical protein
LAVQRGDYIDYDLETIPLEIRTESTIGSGDEVNVRFFSSQGRLAGRVFIRFTSPPQYELGWCTDGNNFPTNLPTDTVKVWRLTLTRTSGVRIMMHCNEVEVLNFLISGSTCSYTSWSDNWSSKVAAIQFPSLDTASDYYRPAGSLHIFRPFNKRRGAYHYQQLNEFVGLFPMKVP